MTRYVADADQTMCLICRQPVVPTKHESSNFAEDNRTTYELKFDLRQTATADLDRAVGEVNDERVRLLDQRKLLEVLIDRAHELSNAYYAFYDDPGSDSIGSLFDAARDLAHIADSITPVDDDDDDDYGIHDDTSKAVFDGNKGYNAPKHPIAEWTAEIDQNGSFGY